MLPAGRVAITLTLIGRRREPQAVDHGPIRRGGGGWDGDDGEGGGGGQSIVENLGVDVDPPTRWPGVDIDDVLIEKKTKWETR